VLSSLASVSSISSSSLPTEDMTSSLCWHKWNCQFSSLASLGRFDVSQNNGCFVGSTVYVLCGRYGPWCSLTVLFASKSACGNSGNTSGNSVGASRRSLIPHKTHTHTSMLHCLNYPTLPRTSASPLISEASTSLAGRSAGDKTLGSFCTWPPSKMDSFLGQKLWTS